MKVHQLKDINTSLFKKPVVTVGIFDGVHRGHTAIINILKAKANEVRGDTVILTMWPHPRTVIYPGKEIKLLSTLEEKIELLQSTGVDHLIVAPFEADFSNLTAEEFIKQILVEKINASSLLVGFDNHFGKNKEGGYDVIKKEADKWEIEIIHPAPVFEGRDRISSTDIRLYLELGDVEKASLLLGYQYSLTGKVVTGRMLGRAIGFPTANINSNEVKMIPRIGVYAVHVKAEGNLYKGMLNIGFRPTVESSHLHKTIEVHLLNYEGDLYNKEITVTFARRLRDEIKFANIEALKAQLDLDRDNVLKLLKDL